MLSRSDEKNLGFTRKFALFLSKNCHLNNLPRRIQECSLSSTDETSERGSVSGSDNSDVAETSVIVCSRFFADRKSNVVLTHYCP